MRVFGPEDKVKSILEVTLVLPPDNRRPGARYNLWQAGSEACVLASFYLLNSGFEA